MVASCMIMLNLSEKEIRSYSYVDDFIVLFEKKADDGCRLNNRCTCDAFDYSMSRVFVFCVSSVVLWIYTLSLTLEFMVLIYCSMKIYCQ